MNPGRFDEYATRLTKIEWFAKAGQPSDKYEVAATAWPAARVLLHEEAFGDRKMSAQNLLSSHLWHHHLEADRAWNEVVELAWAKLDAEKPKFVKAIPAVAEREPVWKRCRAILTLAFSEAWYSELALPEMRFGRGAFAAFEAGRLPCGYAGEFPDGKFRVF